MSSPRLAHDGGRWSRGSHVRRFSAADSGPWWKCLVHRTLVGAATLARCPSDGLPLVRGWLVASLPGLVNWREPVCCLLYVVTLVPMSWVVRSGMFLHVGFTVVMASPHRRCLCQGLQAGSAARLPASSDCMEVRRKVHSGWRADDVCPHKCCSPLGGRHGALWPLHISGHIFRWSPRSCGNLASLFLLRVSCGRLCYPGAGVAWNRNRRWWWGAITSTTMSLSKSQQCGTTRSWWRMRDDRCVQGWRCLALWGPSMTGMARYYFNQDKRARLICFAMRFLFSRS
jgi:hypothetical protein